MVGNRYISPVLISARCCLNLTCTGRLSFPYILYMAFCTGQDIYNICELAKGFVPYLICLSGYMTSHITMSQIQKFAIFPLSNITILRSCQVNSIVGYIIVELVRISLRFGDLLYPSHVLRGTVPCPVEYIEVYSNVS